jgi:hypothetical protein
MDKKLDFQKGQSLVMISILLFAIMALLAFVIDLGYAHYMRRVAQNAADAGALAGAAAYCSSEPLQAEIAATTAANTYVQANNATLSSITFPDGIVNVTSQIIFNTFFGQVLNRATITVRAEAASGCFPPGGSNVIPIAWSCRPPVDAEWDPDKCELKYMEGEVCSFPEDPVYIVADDIPIELEVTCQFPPNTNDPPGAIDCDFDDDGEDDIAGIQGGTKTWLNLDGGSGPASELVDWISGAAKVLINPHTWVPPSEGAKTDVYHEVGKYLNKDFVIPIYDRICEGLPPGDCPGVTWDDGDIVIGNDNQDHFHIINFAFFRPICTDPQAVGTPKPNCEARERLEEILTEAAEAQGINNVQFNSMKTIEGCFKEGFVQGTGGDPDAPFTGTWTIYLIK